MRTAVVPRSVVCSQTAERPRAEAVVQNQNADRRPRRTEPPSSRVSRPPAALVGLNGGKMVIPDAICPPGPVILSRLNVRVPVTRPDSADGRDAMTCLTLGLVRSRKDGRTVTCVRGLRARSGETTEQRESSCREDPLGATGSCGIVHWEPTAPSWGAGGTEAARIKRWEDGGDQQCLADPLRAPVEGCDWLSTSQPVFYVGYGGLQ
ncbi:hypothetical protein EYF80_020806 [Liparis tanakae]|uniref:Uncharacterized protein n=1 Tax=Liparis tanakae TaxID=230148 RepID=A0A4Z2HUE4_9TELE|nr:hypothetical protein EYF80_020806 [Liparis tanakae]